MFEVYEKRTSRRRRLYRLLSPCIWAHTYNGLEIRAVSSPRVPTSTAIGQGVHNILSGCCSHSMEGQLEGCDRRLLGDVLSTAGGWDHQDGDLEIKEGETREPEETLGASGEDTQR